MSGQLFHAEADKKITLVIVSMVGLALVVCLIVAVPRIIQNRRWARAQHRLATVDQLVAEGNYQDAANLLQELQQRGVPDDIKPELDSRLAELKPFVQAAEQQQRAAEQRESAKRRQKTDQRRAASKERGAEREWKRVIARAERQENLRAIGGVRTGLLTVLVLGFGGCVLAGFGQVILAFRDMVINSYLVASSTDALTARTPVPGGRGAPVYRFIPFIAVIFYVVAAILFAVALVMFLYILFNLG